MNFTQLEKATITYLGTRKAQIVDEKFRKCPKRSSQARTTRNMQHLQKENEGVPALKYIARPQQIWSKNTRNWSCRIWLNFSSKADSKHFLLTGGLIQFLNFTL